MDVRVDVRVDGHVDVKNLFFKSAFSSIRPGGRPGGRPAGRRFVFWWTWGWTCVRKNFKMDVIKKIIRAIELHFSNNAHKIAELFLVPAMHEQKVELVGPYDFLSEVQALDFLTRRPPHFTLTSNRTSMWTVEVAVGNIRLCVM